VNDSGYYERVVK